MDKINLKSWRIQSTLKGTVITKDSMELYSTGPPICNINPVLMNKKIEKLTRCRIFTIFKSNKRINKRIQQNVTKEFPQLRLVFYAARSRKSTLVRFSSFYVDGIGQDKR